MSEHKSSGNLTTKSTCYVWGMVSQQVYRISKILQSIFLDNTYKFITLLEIQRLIVSH